MLQTCATMKESSKEELISLISMSVHQQVLLLGDVNTGHLHQGKQPKNCLVYSDESCTNMTFVLGRIFWIMSTTFKILEIQLKG